MALRLNKRPIPTQVNRTRRLSQSQINMGLTITGPGLPAGARSAGVRHECHSLVIVADVCRGQFHRKARGLKLGGYFRAIVPRQAERFAKPPVVGKISPDQALEGRSEKPL